MKQIFKTCFLLILVLFLFQTVAAGQEEKNKPRELFYTYIGPIVSSGFNYIYESDWYGDVNRQENRNFTGYFFTGGFVLSIFMYQFTGDFSIQYIYNINDKYDLQHLQYAISGKWVFNVSTVFNITTGLGLYFETPPSNKEYDGAAGGQVLVGGIFNTTFDTKLYFDFFARYGFYGIGEGSSKVSYGMSIGFIFKVGRI